LGSASFVAADGVAVGALAAVNSFGSPFLPGTRVFWAWADEIAGEFGGARPPADWRGPEGFPPDTKIGAAAAGANTTLALVATDAALTPSQARRLAVMAQDGLARALRPVHGPTDGDVVFALSTAPPADNDGPAYAPVYGDDPLALTRLGDLAAACVARAVARGVHLAA
ncbi:MAG: P1 family peptidase, partial [Pseudomonadota bacterium]